MMAAAGRLSVVVAVVVGDVVAVVENGSMTWRWALILYVSVSCPSAVPRLLSPAQREIPALVSQYQSPRHSVAENELHLASQIAVVAPSATINTRATLLRAVENRSALPWGYAPTSPPFSPLNTTEYTDIALGSSVVVAVVVGVILAEVVAVVLTEVVGVVDVVSVLVPVVVPVEVGVVVPEVVPVEVIDDVLVVVNVVVPVDVTVVDTEDV